MPSTICYLTKILIQNSDKGNSVIVFHNRQDYISYMNEMSSDTSKFRNIDIKSGIEIYHLLQLEDKLISFLRVLRIL